MDKPVQAEVVLLPMTGDEARQIVDRIKGHLNEARRLIYDLYQREGWRAMGYGSWRECVVAEFEQGENMLYRQLQAAEVEFILFDNCQKVGEIPEGQLRPLAPLRNDPDAVREAWNLANERTDGQPTGRDVQEAVDEVLESDRPSIPALHLNPWTHSEKLRREQVEQGFSVVANNKADHRLIHWAQSQGRAVWIDRGTAWGNPFILDLDGDRDAVCENYRTYLGLKPSLQRKADEIRGGKVLVCWCYPERCHGDILITELCS